MRMGMVGVREGGTLVLVRALLQLGCMYIHNLIAVLLSITVCSSVQMANSYTSVQSLSINYK